MTLPDPIDKALRPLFQEIPIDRAMPTLLAEVSPQSPAHPLASRLAADPTLGDRPELVAAIWLYVDDLDRSHRVSQNIETPTGSYWHGIMHRREGDFSNCRYWFRRAGQHPVIAEVPGYDPFQFVDEVEAATRSGGDAPAELLEMQRTEWMALVTWCANQPASDTSS